LNTLERDLDASWPSLAQPPRLIFGIYAPLPAGELLEMIQSLRVSAPSFSSTVVTVELKDNYNVYKVFRIVNTQF
jgi:hypothetical protein